MANEKEHCKCGDFVDESGQHKNMTAKCESGKLEEAKLVYDDRYFSVLDSRIVNFAKRVENGEATDDETLLVSKINNKEKDKIEELIGRPIYANNHIIKASEIRHTLKRHGKAGKADQTMSNIEEFGLIGFVISNFDNIKLIPEDNSSFCNSTGKSAEVIGYEKRLNGNKLIVVEAISDGRKGNLHIVSAYKK